MLLQKGTFRCYFKKTYQIPVFFLKRVHFSLILQWAAFDNQMLIRSGIGSANGPPSGGIMGILKNNGNKR